jgi:hypothetical protein
MINKIIEVRSVLLMECILRFRRSTTPILFLILCGAAFLLMPETSSGGVMFLIGNQRVLLNSAATALTSAIMGGLVFSLVGFYLISNSVSRDLRTGVGKLIASTPLSSFRYLAGKLAGNIVYLAAMAAVFMIACMGMHLLRGEMPLEPIVFVQTFGIMFLPSIPCIAAIALMFECVPFLSGRGGDVLYFFFWTLTLALPPALVSASKGHAWILAADFTGLGFFVKEIISVTGAHNFTIGYAPFNAALPPLFFSGLTWISEIVILRLASVFFTIPFFGIAWAAFRRFDPARRSSHKKTETGKIARLWQKIISVWHRIVVPRGGWFVGPPSLVKAIALDVRLTLALYPIFFVVIAFSLFTGLFAPISTIRTSILPIMFFILVPLLASISTRDRFSNTARLIFSAPLVRQQFAAVKFFSALFSAMLVGFILLVRMSLEDPFSSAAALTGMVFMASAATLLGLLTGTPKTFVVMFLLFLYIAVSSKTAPAFDFAGMQGIVTPSIVLLYAAASLLMAVAGFGFERWRMKTGESL